MTPNRYQVFLPDCEHARALHHSIRYKVFCQDRKFEDPADHPGGMEADQYDGQSAHFLVRDRTRAEWTGASRLILPGPQPLQIEKLCKLNGRVGRQVGTMAEVSRLAVLGRYRRRRLERHYHEGVGPSPAARPAEHREVCRRHEPGVMIALIRAMTQYGIEAGVSHAAFFVVPGLARIISRLALQTTPIGPPIQHRGERYPFLIEAGELLTKLFDEPSARKPMYRAFSDVAPLLTPNPAQSQSIPTKKKLVPLEAMCLPSSGERRPIAPH